MAKCLNNLNFSFFFPGQGSQGVGMGLDFYHCFQFVRTLYAQANDVLGFDIRDHMFHGKEHELQDTCIAQPALFISSVVAYEVFKLFCKIAFSRDNKISYYFGHSIGEYVALYSSGAVDFVTGLKLVKRRSECMSECAENVGGGMLAVIGCIPINVIQSYCDDVVLETGQPCEIANINSDSQIIVSGVLSGLRILKDKLKGYVPKLRLIPLNVAGAFHSSLMKHAALSFKDTCSKFDISSPKVPIIFNYNASTEDRVERIIDNLYLQIDHRVLWHQSMLKAMETGTSVFVEFGHGKVLTRLCKSSFPSVSTYNITGMQDVYSFLDSVVVD